MQQTDGFNHRLDTVEETYCDLEDRSEETISECNLKRLKKKKR
jgi:hypothetical protein